MRLVDTHCHLDFDRFNADRDEVIQRAKDDDVVRIVIPAIDMATTEAAIGLAEQHAMIYATVGIHPNSVPDVEEPLGHAINRLREYADHPKVVAVGEIGLDYHWNKAPKGVQARWFDAQLDLATDLDLPVVIHNRESTEDMIAQLQQWRDRNDRERPGVLHSFSGTWPDAEAALDMGFYLGFTGPITYRNAKEMRYIATHMPEGRILIETDAPFLTPQIKRGDRNEPAYVRYVAEKIGELRGMAPDEVGELTTRNADTLFGLDL